jgi:hypothetical protein
LTRSEQISASLNEIMLLRRHSEEDWRWLIDFTLHAGKITRHAVSAMPTWHASFGQPLETVTLTIETSTRAGNSDIPGQPGQPGPANVTAKAISP